MNGLSRSILKPTWYSIKYTGIKKIKPKEITTWSKLICDSSYFCLFNKVEYSAQENMATTIVISPLLKSKFFKISKFALVIIIITPKNESITPIIWNTFVFSIFKIDEKNIIITGIVDIIKTPLITWVKFNE